MTSAGIQDHADDPLGGLLHQARASRGTKLIYLVGAIGAFGAAAVVWPELQGRFGGLMSWVLTLRHNPRVAAPGLIPLVAVIAGVWASVRLAHALRQRVEVRELGIRLLPGGRTAFWEDIEDLRFAERRLRGGAGLTRVSLQLRPRHEKPIDLSHRFTDMDALIQVVRRQIEPRLIEQAVAAVELDGRVSFGPLVTVQKDRLILGQGKREVALDRVESCGIRGGQFSVLEPGPKLIFARSSELIPNATIIGAVVARLR